MTNSGLQLGFVGLGIMGAPMAGHLLRSGYALSVYNRTRAKTEPLRQLGATVADTPAQVAARSDITIVMVSDTPDVEAVIAGEDGVMHGVRAGSLVVDMSTVSPEAERRLDVRLRERGARLCDGPVSGGDVGAKNGTLAVMVGGDAPDIERIRPVLGCFAKRVTHCGPVGSGQITKLCNQVLVGLNLLGVCEALALARKNGVDPKVMVEAIEQGAAGSWQLSNLGPRIIGRDFAPGFMVDLMQKDLRIVMGTATASGTPLCGTSLVHQLFAEATAHGGGKEGTQTLAKVVERLAGLLPA